MSFDINEFSARVNKYGLARNNLFFMRIFPPKAATSGLNMDDFDLRFLCRSANIPDLSISAQSVPRQGYGRGERMPSDVQFGDLEAIFMVDSNFDVLKTFHRWMQLVSNYNSYDGFDRVISNGAGPFQLGYKDSYSVIIQVVVWSINEATVNATYSFSGAWPSAMGTPKPAWENQTEIMTIPVTFSFDGFKAVGAGTGSKIARRPGTDGTYYADVYTNPLSGISEFLQTVNNLGAGLRGLGIDNNIQDYINDVTRVTGTVFSQTNRIESVLDGTFF